MVALHLFSGTVFVWKEATVTNDQAQTTCMGRGMTLAVLDTIEERNLFATYMTIEMK